MSKANVESELPPPRCTHCGYNVTGVASPQCPECGSEFLVPICRVTKLMQHHAVAGALDAEDIPFTFIESKSTHQQPADFLAGGLNFGSAVFLVNRDDVERARMIVDDAMNSAPRPIVDRSEPICPKCDAPLDPLGRAHCEKCGTEFQWIEIEQPTIDPTGRLCRQCGYDLTGLSSELCPECECEIADPVELVELASPSEQVAATNEIGMPRWLMPMLISILFGLSLTLLLSMNGDAISNGLTLLLGVFTISFLVMFVALIIRLFRYGAGPDSR